MKESLKAWIEGELATRGWSYRMLAKEAGLSQAFISLVLAGQREVSDNFAEKIAETLEVDVETIWALAGKSRPTTEDKELNEALELLRQMTPERRKEALRYLRFLHAKKNEA